MKWGGSLWSCQISSNQSIILSYLPLASCLSPLPALSPGGRGWVGVGTVSHSILQNKNCQYINCLFLANLEKRISFTIEQNNKIFANSGSKGTVSSAMCARQAHRHLHRLGLDQARARIPELYWSLCQKGKKRYDRDRVQYVGRMQSALLLPDVQYTKALGTLHLGSWKV